VPLVFETKKSQQIIGQDIYVATSAIPHLIVRFQGVPKSTAPKPPADIPSLILRLNGVVRAIIPHQARPDNDGQSTPSIEPEPESSPEQHDINDAEEGGRIRDVPVLCHARIA
jgi:hypothetical protein